MTLTVDTVQIFLRLRITFLNTWTYKSVCTVRKEKLECGSEDATLITLNSQEINSLISNASKANSIDCTSNNNVINRDIDNILNDCIEDTLYRWLSSSDNYHIKNEKSKHIFEEKKMGM